MQIRCLRYYPHFTWKMDRLFDLLLLDALVKAAREEEEDRPDNFFVLPANDNQVWQNVFKNCIEENMVVGVEFTTADQSQKPIRADILRLARQFNRQAIFLRAPIGPLSTHDQLRRELGGVQYTPSFLIVSFLEDRGEIRRYEGNLEVRAAFETGKVRRDFEECLERRARIRVAENLAERLAAGMAAAMEARRQREEERAKETPEQRRAREAQEQAKRREQAKEEEERKIQEEQKEIDEARKAAIEERKKKRPEYVTQLLAMDLQKAPIKDILGVMKKLGVDPAGLLERKDLIAELRQKVPELGMKLDNPSSTPVGVIQQPPSPSSSGEDFSNMDHDLLQAVAHRIRKIDLQGAELHELKSLLSQARLTVKNYPDRNSMVQALKRVVDAAERTRNQSSYFGTVYQSRLSNNLSTDDTDINKFEQQNSNVEERDSDQDSRREVAELQRQVAELQRQLAEKDQKNESLSGEIRKLEIKAKIAENSGRRVFPPGP